MIDLVSTLLFDTEEKLGWSKEALDNQLFADSIYHSYSAFINTAKALLLTKDVKPSTQIQTMNDFQHHFVEPGLFSVPGNNFKEHVLRINKNEPTEIFAIEYRTDAKRFMEDVFAFRNNENETILKS
jgi:sulfite reductase (ferredoxin)